jgi:hypothetical protein
LLIRS